MFIGRYLNMRFFVLALASLLLCLPARAQDGAVTSVPGEDALVDDSDTTRVLFEEVMAAARQERLHERSIGEIMQAIGLQFLGRPYVVGMLDEDMEETLVLKLEGYDCVTFVETVLALSRGVAVEDYSYGGFAERVREQRYRHGVMDGYCSRLHYFTEWIADNDGRGIVQDVTEQLGGERLDTRFGFMTEHRESYPQMAASDSLFEGIIEVERDLADLTVYHIPQDVIHEAYDGLEAGDLVAITTDINGLDVAHTGLVYRGEDGSVGLLHASVSDGVVVSPDLQSYVQNNARQVGIVVARPVDPGAGHSE